MVPGRHARRDAELAARAALDARFTAFLTAVDALALETNQLPSQSRQAELVNSWMAKRMPTLDYFFGAISRAILGRPLYAAMHDFQLAGNALLFGTPVEVLRACELIADSFKDFQVGSEEQEAGAGEAGLRGCREDGGDRRPAPDPIGSPSARLKHDRGRLFLAPRAQVKLSDV